MSGPCTAAGCERERKVRGLCKRHYNRWAESPEGQQVLAERRTGLPAAEVMGLVDGILRRLGWTRGDLYAQMGERYGKSLDAFYRRVRRAERSGVVPVALADELLTALDSHLYDLPSVREAA